MKDQILPSSYVAISKISTELANESKLIKEQRKLFWQERLTGIEAVDLRFLQLSCKQHKLPNNLISKEKLANKGKIDFSFDKNILAKLKKLNKKYNIISPYLYGQAIYAMLMHRYTGQDKFGVSYQVKLADELQAFISNNYVSIAPCDFSKLKNIFEILIQTQEFTKLLEQDKVTVNYLPITEIISATNKEWLKGSFSQIYTKNSDYKFDDIKANNNNAEINLENELSFEEEINDKSINYIVKYKTDEIDFYLLQEFIACYKRLYQEILEELIQTKDLNKLTPIKQYKLLSDEQHKKIVYLWNQTDKEYPIKSKTIQQLFEEQVEKSADKVALIYEEKKLTYTEVNEQANRLAHYLKQQYRIEPDDLVALCLDRNEQMIVSMLAVLKAGGAYVPMDPTYPDERKRYILEDTGAKAILTNDVYKNGLEQIIKGSIPPASISRVIAIDSKELQEKLFVQPRTNPQTKTVFTNLAYVIYTSGTTGNPKGVMLEHKGIVNLKYAMTDIYKLSTSECMLQVSNYVFDSSVEEIILALLGGHKLAIPSKLTWENDTRFHNYLTKHKVTHVAGTPSLLGQYNLKNISTIKRVSVGGEELTKEYYNALSGKHKLYDTYGPTEATVNCIVKEIKAGNLNIGRSIFNMKAYVLNANLEPVPIGAIGELYIGGVALARGYLNRPDLTEERFISNPFQSKEEKRDKSYGLNGKNACLYKTGDLVRWLSDGNLEYVGRNDFQVKIKGYRIELGEIESAICSYDNIKQAIVLAKEHNDSNNMPTGNKYLVAYYIKELEVKNDDTKNYVNIWETIYQSSYSALDINNYKQNLNVWVSSYTGRAIPKEDMLEWVHETVQRIKGLEPNVILEIGSGSGLILFNIIDKCDYYYATDFSANVIDYTARVIDKFGYYDKVSAFCCSAEDLPYDKIQKAYDTVIMNSVVLHFPNIDYLETVIDKTILNMANSGQIFIGDIIDYRLQKCFHYSVQKYKKGHVTKAEIDYFASRDKDLFISPEYFIYLQATNKAISNIEVMPKLGKADHEMNNYRYDVIIHIDKNKSNIKNSKKDETIYVKENDFIEVTEFDSFFTSNIDKEYICLKYPNKRIMKMYEEFNLIYDNVIRINSDTLKHTYILSINEIISKAEDKNFTLKFFLNINDPLYINIVLYNNSYTNIYINYDFDKDQYLRTELSNNPLITHKLLENEFTAELKEYLKSKLPEYMVPNHYILLEKLPLTINGKLDTKSLPEPNLLNKEGYIAPRNKLETEICHIWAEVLGFTDGKVGIQDDFFSLGGNSILAIKVINKLNNHLNISISTTSIFKYKTVEKLAESIQENRQNVIINKSNITNPEQQVLSFGQERLWFIEKYEKGTNAYNIPMIFKVAINTRLDLLEKSIQSLITRHEVLKTIIKQDNEGNSYQFVVDNKEQPLVLTNIKVKNKALLNQELDKAANHIYDLSNEYPIRVQLYELINDNHNNSELYLSIVIHHIAFDGWSSDIFLRELKEYYSYYLSKDNGIKVELNLPKLEIQYRDFAQWQKENYLNDEESRKQLSYWRNKLAGYETLNLITDKSRPIEKDYNGKNIHFQIDEKDSKCLRELAKNLKVSLYSVLLAGYYLMLRMYSNQNDIVIGIPIANRHYSHVENLIGFFVNTLVLRTEIDNDKTISEFIQTIGEDIAAVQLNQDLPFEKLVQELKIERDASRNPIFQVMFDIQSFANDTESIKDKQSKTNLDSLLQEYKPNIELFNIAPFDLTTSLDDSNTTIKGVFNYAISLYNEETVKRFIETYREILRQFAELANNKEKQECFKIADINYLNQKDYELIVHKWNATEKEYPTTKTIQQVFEEQVEKNPDHIALVYKDIKLTYGELNEQANRLAHHLKDKYSIEPNDPIALCLDRSEHMIIAILAVLKAGGAYVPMDLSYPDERVSYILKDTKSKTLIVNGIHKSRLHQLVKASNIESEIIAIDSTDLQQVLHLESVTAPQTVTVSTNLAYIIYTSGTTGNPKGVMINHWGVINMIQWQKDYFSIDSNTRIAQFATFSFDGAVGETFSALLNGCTLIMMTRSVDPTMLIEEINYYHINLIVLIPSLLRYLDLEKLKYKEDLTIVSVGEPCSIDLAQNCLPHCKLVNAYGPTETTVYSHAYFLSQGSLGTIPIGYPINNYKSYILDKQGNPVPIGVSGEIFITGAGIGRGYLNNPDLTAEKFQFNPLILKHHYTQQGTIVNESAQLQIEEFKKIRQERVIQNLEEGLSNYDLEELFEGLDEDLEEQKKALVHKLCDPSLRRELRYVKEAILGNYASCGITSEILRVMLPFDNFKNLVGIDFGFGNGEILSILKNMGANITGLDTNLFFVQNMRNNGINAYTLRIDEDTKDFSQIITSLIPTDLCDFVISTLTLDRLERPVNFLQNFFSVLKMGGKFALQTLLPVRGIDDGNNEDPIIYTPNDHKITPGMSVKQDMLALVGQLVELGGEQIKIYKIPYVVASRDGIQTYTLYSFCGIKGENKISPNNCLRMYSTGDLGRYTHNGNIEYIGRNDFQLKIRGYRIELDEIESTLSSYTGIKQSIVLTKEYNNEDIAADNKYLVAYYVADTKLDEQDILTYLQNKLPEYMIPSTLVHLEKLPLTITGKLDRKALPDPELVSQKNYIAPRNEFEAKVCQIWAEVLGIPIDKVGINDDFFRLGGNSIVSIQLVSKLKQKLELHVSIKDIFTHKTVQKLLDNGLNRSLNGNKVIIKTEDEKAYWNNVTLDYKGNKKLEKLIVEENTQNKIEISLSEKTTHQLLQESNKAYSTQINDLLLTALGVTLAKITSNKINHILLTRRGRGAIDSNVDITRRVDCFQVMYPVRFEIGDNLGSNIKYVKESLKQIPNKGIGYGVLFGYDSDKLPKINFTYLEQFDHELESYQNNKAIPVINIANHSIVSINPMIIEKKLRLGITSKLSKVDTIKIGKIFEETLEEIVKYCNFKPVEWSISDFADFEPYVSFNNDRNNKLFIFPPGEGGAESYFNNIVPRLNDYKLVLFNNYHLYLSNKFGPKVVNNITIKQLATEYISYIKPIQAVGPYNLCGWSFGGTIALEIAKQLIEMGENVRNIILIDSFSDYETAISTVDNLLPREADINIVLFKALIDSSDFKNYSDQTNANHTGKTINRQNFEIIDMEHDHYSWVNDKSQVTKICDQIKELLSN